MLSLDCENMEDTVSSAIPQLSLGSSDIYEPLGDYVAGFQTVDWDVLAAVQFLNSHCRNVFSFSLWHACVSRFVYSGSGCVESKRSQLFIWI